VKSLSTERAPHRREGGHTRETGPLDASATFEKDARRLHDRLLFERDSKSSDHDMQWRMTRLQP
jgi:hypothetical protein